MRIFVDALLGRGNAHPAQHLDGAPARLAAREAAVAHDRLDDLLADRVGGIERGHRLLKDHGKPIAAQVAQRAVGQAQEIDAVEADGARNVAVPLRVCPETLAGIAEFSEHEAD